MKTEQVVQAIVKEMKENPAADAVMHSWALRKRARSTVTLGALHKRMQAEGFQFEYEEYKRILKLLAHSGIGKLELDSKGEPVALKEIRTTLQSIGKAACEGKSVLKATGFKPQALPQKAPQLVSVTGIVVKIGSRSIVIFVPENASGRELSTLLVRLQGGEV